MILREMKIFQTTLFLCVSKVIRWQGQKLFYFIFCHPKYKKKYFSFLERKSFSLYQCFIRNNNNKNIIRQRWRNGVDMMIFMYVLLLWFSLSESMIFLLCSFWWWQINKFRYICEKFMCRYQLDEMRRENFRSFILDSNALIRKIFYLSTFSYERTRLLNFSLKIIVKLLLSLERD
jgi:hypothetical protein